MAITKRALLASGATLAVATAARAQAPGPNQAPGQYQGSGQTEDVILNHLSDNQGLHLDQSGRVSRIKMSEAGMAAVRKHGREMTTGQAFVYRDGGRQYVVSNEKMQDGTMLFDHMRDWRS
jgi:hypothetical protein